MGANGLIVAFVVAVWAAYFVPLVLRRYDEASSSESLEPLSPLSRVVSRRRGAEDVVDDVQNAAEEDAVEVTVEPDVRAPRAARTTPSAPQRRAAVVAARRRRRTLITLLSALTVVGVLAAFSVVAPVWVAAPALLVVAWLVACRVQVRAERGVGRPKTERTSLSDRVPSSLKRAARSATEHPARRSAAPSADEEHTVVVSHQFEDVDPGRKHVMERAELPEDALEEKLQIAVPSISTQGAPLWDPLPVTLPTYVTKPRVGRTVRTIDFDAPGAWTSGHVEGEDVELPGRPRSGEAEAQPSRRAAGE